MWGKNGGNLSIRLKKKKLWEKEKLLVTSNFSFSLNVFHKSSKFVLRNVRCGKNGGKFTNTIRKKNVEGKGEIGRYEQFLLFSQCFRKA